MIRWQSHHYKRHSGTDWYDQAFSETVLESLDFGYYDIPNEIAYEPLDPPPDTKWWCIMGGAQELAFHMEKRLKMKPQYQSRVTAIRVGKTSDMEIDVTSSAGKMETKPYNGVFNSTTLGCLRRMDTTGSELSYEVKQAARSLGYGESAKVAIKFQSAWWIHKLPKKFQIRRGGLGHTDMNIRTCVYPSYNILDAPDKPAVLLCTYTWQQDAERLGSLISSSQNHDQQLAEEVPLKDLLLRELVELHKNDEMTEKQLRDLIWGQYLDHYAHDWTHDPNAEGAFAFFRPQQFTSLWGSIIHPGGNLVIVGEAASPHHAWVVGALESAVFGVHSWLVKRVGDIDGALEAIQELEKVECDNPFVGLPPYMEKNTARWVGLLAQMQSNPTNGSGYKS
jgi:hypothetical protein